MPSFLLLSQDPPEQGGWNIELLLGLLSAIRSKEDVRNAHNTAIYKVAELAIALVQRTMQSRKWNRSPYGRIVLSSIYFRDRTTEAKDRYLPHDYRLPEGVHHSRVHEIGGAEEAAAPKKRKRKTAAAAEGEEEASEASSVAPKRTPAKKKKKRATETVESEGEDEEEEEEESPKKKRRSSGGAGGGSAKKKTMKAPKEEPTPTRERIARQAKGGECASV